VRSAEGPSEVEKHPKDPREFPIGFNSVTPVPANGTVGIEQKPQVLFRGERRRASRPTISSGRPRRVVVAEADRWLRERRDRVDDEVERSARAAARREASRR
jgi:hypothetical protein